MTLFLEKNRLHNDTLIYGQFPSVRPRGTLCKSFLGISFPTQDTTGNGKGTFDLTPHSGLEFVDRMSYSSSVYYSYRTGGPIKSPILDTRDFGLLDRSLGTRW